MDLLERFAGGDVDAFETLFRRHQGEVYGWIVRLVRNPGVAEELTIETFWRIYRHRQRFDAGRPFGPWARRIATRAAIDHLNASAPVWTVRPPTAPPSDPDPVEQRELRGCIERAFVALPARLRAAAILALVEERPYPEIAEALGISLSATKMRVRRAVRALRARLERMGVGP